MATTLKKDIAGTDSKDITGSDGIKDIAATDETSDESDLSKLFLGADDAYARLNRYVRDTYYNGEVNHLSNNVAMDLVLVSANLIELKLSRQERMKDGRTITHTQTFQIKIKNIPLSHILSAADEAFQKFAEF